MERPGKKQLNARLTEEAYERLRDFSGEHGASMVSFLEAICMHLDDGAHTRWMNAVIADARRLEQERRRRSRT